jgi:hypothetical protein
MAGEPSNSCICDLGSVGCVENPDLKGETWATHSCLVMAVRLLGVLWVCREPRSQRRDLGHPFLSGYGGAIVGGSVGV